MSTVFESSVVRIYNSNSGKVVGAGFLVSHKHIITCAHVVAYALGIDAKSPEMPSTEVSFDFPRVATKQILKATVVFWRPVNPDRSDEDIAGLELLELPPDSGKPVRLVTSEDLWGHSFRVLGFPKGRSDGAWADGELRGAIANGWLQVEDVRVPGYRLEEGFSGAPVWDETLQGVAGIAVAADKLRPEARAGFIIPAKVLIKAWDVLAQRAIDACPYRGLSAFREEDAEFFFGREEFTEKLVTAVERQQLVPVIGPSGSGKSSVVFAGLIPKLRQQPEWLIADFRPTTHPFEELAAALVSLREPEESKVQRDIDGGKLSEALEKGELTVRTVLSRILEDNSHLLLVADQFEQLYTLCEDIQKRRLFLEQLLEAVNHLPNLTLVLTLRADFLGSALSDRPLADALQNGDVKLGPMNRQELLSTIVKPAQKLGVSIEPGLTERILEDVEKSPGNLPLLEFALTRLWKKHQEGHLTHEAYQKIGGVEQALANYAEELYGKLTETDKQKAQRLFIQLVHPGKGTEDTRRIATRHEVGEDNWHLVTRSKGLADGRLVVTGRNEVTNEETVEVIHEALIREWETLRGWMEANREFRMWQERLKSRWREWDAQGKDDGDLLGGVSLREAVEWQQQRPAELSAEERDFIRCSCEWKERQQQERERQQQEKEKLQGRAIKWLSGGLTVAVVAAGMALWQGFRAVNGERNAEMRARIATLDSRWISGERSLNLQLDVIAVGKELKEASWATSDSRLRGAQFLREMLMKWREYNSIKGHKDEVWSVAFSPDGEYLASASTDKTVKLWKASDGSLVRTLSGHLDRVNSVAFSPDGKYLASASTDKTVKLWKGSDGSLVRTLSGHQDRVNSVAFSPDGNSLASASEDGTVKLWKRSDGSLVRTFSGHQGSVSSVVFSPDGNSLASASLDGTVKLWKSDNGSLVHTFSGHSDWVNSVAFSPDGKYLASASDDKTVKLWKASDGSLVHTFSGHQGSVNSVAFGPDGNSLASAGSDKTVKLWKGSNGSLVHTLSGHQEPVINVVFSPDGKYLASASEDKTVKLWKGSNGSLVHTFSGHQGWVNSVVFSPDGQYLASASNDGTVKLWKVSNGSLVHTLQGHQDRVISVVFSADGKYVASASNDRTVKLWKASNGSLVHTFSGHQSWVKSVVFSPDGRYLASASLDKTVKLWKASDGSLVHTLQGHQSWVNSVVFGPDGRYLASASNDGTVKRWKASDGSLVHTLLGHSDGVISVVFSPDGKYLASASEDKTVKLWNLNLEDLLQRACHGVGGYLKNNPNATDDRRGLCNIQPSASVLVYQGKELARKGDVERAVAKLQKALELDPNLNIDASSWNSLCWYGSLHGHATDIMFACEKAVTLAPEHGGIRDSRGLARALTGDTEGAIEDFQAYIRWTESDDAQNRYSILWNDNSLARNMYPHILEEFRQSRQGWIDALRRGENPFTPEVLKSLHDE